MWHSSNSQPEIYVLYNLESNIRFVPHLHLQKRLSTWIWAPKEFFYNFMFLAVKWPLRVLAVKQHLTDIVYGMMELEGPVLPLNVALFAHSSLWALSTVRVWWLLWELHFSSLCHGVLMVLRIAQCCEPNSRESRSSVACSVYYNDLPASSLPHSRVFLAVGLHVTWVRGLNVCDLWTPQWHLFMPWAQENMSPPPKKKTFIN